MTTYQPDRFVRHLKRPDLGYGRVVALEPDRFRVRFASGEEKTFLVSGAAAFIELVQESAVPELVRARLSRKTDRPDNVPATKKKCSACGTKLRSGRYSRDGAWKSCPPCSAAQGDRHVYRRRPDAFGTTSKRENTENADGIQSHCTACRGNDPPDFEHTEFRLCGDLPTQARQP